MRLEQSRASEKYLIGYKLPYLLIDVAMVLASATLFGEEESSDRDEWN